VQVEQVECHDSWIPGIHQIKDPSPAAERGWRLRRGREARMSMIDDHFFLFSEAWS